MANLHILPARPCSPSPPSSAPSSSRAPSAPQQRGTHRRPHAVTIWPRPSTLRTVTPIKHLVVLFQENVSFDSTSGRTHTR